ncbi:c-type cytochrome [Salaquimonas pukyongi]|uniref:c-type cytochrome n=1 Tax=Salaquimonas pukyongi TaxID=2712698 RepID=UPI0012EB0E15|nr:cytochrome c [Salaquimonas pukyongi]
MKRTLAALVLAVALGGAAFAHQGATGIVKQRMDAMTAMKDAMAVVGRMLKGESAFEPAKAGKAADAIAGHAIEMKTLFPDTPESRQAMSEATPLVWEEAQRFNDLADELAAAARQLSQVAHAGDEAVLSNRFRAVGKACSACHQDFRQKKN